MCEFISAFQHYLSILFSAEQYTSIYFAAEFST